jgi:putative FmdB family regulatory protein
VRYNNLPDSEVEHKFKEVAMPVYAYQCENCGVEFDKQQSFSDQPLVRCPECGKKTLKKVFQPVGIVFKGSGFYATDHHSPSGQSAKKADEKAEKDSKTSVESKETPAKVEKSPETTSEKKE